jgi:hypothetical protein
MAQLNRAVWRKSSHNGGDRAWAQFVQGLKDGEFDLARSEPTGSAELGADQAELARVANDVYGLDLLAAHGQDQHAR